MQVLHSQKADNGLFYPVFDIVVDVQRLLASCEISSMNCASGKSAHLTSIFIKTFCGVLVSQFFGFKAMNSVPCRNVFFICDDEIYN